MLYYPKARTGSPAREQAGPDRSRRHGLPVVSHTTVIWPDQKVWFQK